MPPSPAAADLARREPVSAPAPSLPEPPQRLWERVRSDDARELAARLRAEGVPDRAGRLLVEDLLRSRYLVLERELLGADGASDFWKVAASATDREKQARLRALDRAHRDLLTELYGADEFAAAERERRRRLFGPLGDDKLVRVDRIHADYGEMAEDIRAQVGGAFSAEDRETLALLEQERRKDVAAVLSADELEIYDLQTSATARMLRARLAGFAPTEAEFRALFALHRECEGRLGGGGDEVHQRERATAEKELDERIKAALGAARHDEYRRLQEPGHRMTARIAERFNLPARRAAEVGALKRATEDRLQVLRGDKSLTGDATRQVLAGIEREASERLTGLLGAEGAELYRRTSAGAWLRALERVAKEAPPAVVSAAAPGAVGEPVGVDGASAPVRTGTP